MRIGMTTSLNSIVNGAAFFLTVFFAWSALYAPISIGIGDRAFLVGCAMFAPSVSALLLYFLSQESR